MAQNGLKTITEFHFIDAYISIHTYKPAYTHACIHRICMTSLRSSTTWLKTITELIDTHTSINKNIHTYMHTCMHTYTESARPLCGAQRHGSKRPQNNHRIDQYTHKPTKTKKHTYLHTYIQYIHTYIHRICTTTLRSSTTWLKTASKQSQN